LCHLAFIGSKKRTSVRLKIMPQRRARLLSQQSQRWLTLIDGCIWLHRSLDREGLLTKRASLSRERMRLNQKSSSEERLPRTLGSQDSSQL
jgi:hypothetical protein